MLNMQHQRTPADEGQSDLPGDGHDEMAGGGRVIT
jgi:hypothetical protein